MLWLCACAHTPNASDIPPGATFTTKILADDTKLFVYSQRFARRAPDGGESEEGADEAAGRRDGAERGAQIAQIAKRGVQAMLAQNHYCRDGYVVIEQYEEHGSFIIRGECRDAATSAERSKFGP